MQVEAGSVLVIETGGYSDYSFTGPFRVLKGFDQAEIAEAYREEWVRPTDESWRKGPSATDFIPWLTRKGYIEDMTGVVSWHIGSYGDYGDFSPSIQ